MRILLIGVSFIFSAIFYLFSTLESGNSIIFGKIINSQALDSLVPNLLIPSGGFLFLGILFFIYFSVSKSSSHETINKEYDYSKIYNHIIFQVIIYALFWGFQLYYLKTHFNIFPSFIGGVVFLNISIFCYFFLVKSGLLYQRKKLIKVISLLSLYISSACFIYHIHTYDSNFYILIGLMYSVIFNYEIHKKFTNYISLLMALGIVGFVVYYAINILITVFT